MIPELMESIRMNGRIMVYVRVPSQACHEEAVFELQYTHPLWGSRSEELILFRDGTWRYVGR